MVCHGDLAVGASNPGLTALAWPHSQGADESKALDTVHFSCECELKGERC